MARDTLDLKKARPGHGRCDRIRCVSGLTCVIYVFGMPIPIDINCCIWTEVQNFHSLVMIVMKLVCSALSWSKFGYWYDHGASPFLTAAGHTTFRYRGPTDESFQNSCTDPYSQVLTIHPKFDKCHANSLHKFAQAAHWVWRANWRHNMLVLQMHRSHRFQDWCHVCSLRRFVATAGCR